MISYPNTICIICSGKITHVAQHRNIAHLFARVAVICQRFSQILLMFNLHTSTTVYHKRIMSYTRSTKNLKYAVFQIDIFNIHTSCWHFKRQFPLLRTKVSSLLFLRACLAPLLNHADGTRHVGNVTTLASWEGFYWHGLTLIPEWISNHTPSKVWNEITYPSQISTTLQPL